QAGLTNDRRANDRCFPYIGRVLRDNVQEVRTTHEECKVSSLILLDLMTVTLGHRVGSYRPDLVQFLQFFDEPNRFWCVERGFSEVVVGNRDAPLHEIDHETVR